MKKFALILACFVLASCAAQEIKEPAENSPAALPAERTPEASAETVPTPSSETIVLAEGVTAADRQSQASSQGVLIPISTLFKRQENLLQVRLVNADPGILNAEKQRCPTFLPRGFTNAQRNCALLCELARIGQQVG